MATAVHPELQAVFDREREDARRARPRDSAGIRAQTVAMYGRLAVLQGAVIARCGLAPACAPGCHYCCRLHVEIRPYEAFVLGHHVRTRMPAAQRVRLEARLAENLARMAGMTADEHNRAGIECALLEDRLCTAYGARPVACRKYYSLAMASCRAIAEDPAAPRTLPLEHDRVRLAGNAIALGYAQGCADAGYDAGLCELHGALRCVLAGTSAERRYRDGKRAFV